MIVTFQPMGIKQEAEKGESLIAAAAKASVSIDAQCGGQGTCGKCKVRVFAKVLDDPDEVERKFLSKDELDEGIRLACRMMVRDDMTVHVFPTPGSGNMDRKKDMAIMPDNFKPDIMKGIFGDAGGYYGLSFDIGTTTVVGRLWDLTRAKSLGTAARTNPQSDYGADVISRIMYCNMAEGNLRKMQHKISDCLNDVIEELSKEFNIDSLNIRKISAVGNTTMSHLLLGIDPKSLALAPFTPGFTGSVFAYAKDLNIKIHPEAKVNVLPNIAGHVGSDTVAVLLSSNLKKMEGGNLAIDIGTNGEILLACNGQVLACSTAAGPAFEGACIEQGMRAATGAIEGVRITSNDVELSVIGETQPLGICGSGLIDCVAELLKSGLVTDKGKLLTKEEALNTGLTDSIINRLVKGNKGNSFILYQGARGKTIAITQKDIREVQLAKGAILAGIRIMLQQLELTNDDIQRVFLAGAFGNYIKKDSAITIGLLPDIPVEKVISIGNAAGVGASMALLSDASLKEANELAESTEHIELALHPDFQAIFLKSMYF